MSDDDDEAPRPSAAREAAIVQAQAQDLVRALRPYGVLSRDALLEKCHAGRWPDGSFDRALARAVREGQIRELPDGFYRVTEE